MKKVYYKVVSENELILLDLIFLNFYKNKALHFDGTNFELIDLKEFAEINDYKEYSEAIDFDIEEIREKNDIFYIKLKNDDIFEISISIVGYGEIRQKMILHEKIVKNSFFSKKTSNDYNLIYEKFLDSKLIVLS